MQATRLSSPEPVTLPAHCINPPTYLKFSYENKANFFGFTDCLDDCSGSRLFDRLPAVNTGGGVNTADSAKATTVTESTDPLQRLLDGNRRFVNGTSIHPDADGSRRTSLKSGQKPFAVILSCSDSRVPPEIVFDQGLGDLFVVRVAGNVFDEAVDGSIEYAVEHLGANLIVVLGHESCGAVTAAIEHNEEAHIKFLAHTIEPAIENVIGQPGDKIDNSVRANALYVVEQIKKNEPILTKKIADGKLRVVAAYYDLDKGEVTVIQ